MFGLALNPISVILTAAFIKHIPIKKNNCLKNNEDTYEIKNLSKSRVKLS
jgi:hypothetical protein